MDRAEGRPPARRPAAATASEVTEMRAQLRDPALDSDPARKRKVLQRVIALMTMGFDTASLLPEVTLACFTPDLVSKKLIYFFLTTQSERNPELALLSVNTFLKECSEESPVVRGLALRSLASLKGIPQLFEYLLPALNKALGDPAAYVRRIAVFCVLTVFRASAEEFIAHGYYDKILLMLRDGDPQVSANALAVLLEIAAFDKKWAEQQAARQGRGGGPSSSSSAPGSSGNRRATPPHTDTSYDPSQHQPFTITKAILYHLLNHLTRLNEWQQIQIIDLIHEYTPTSEEEMFDIMNALEDRLTGMHSGLILSCSHAFIYLSQNYPTVHAQVLERLRQPLLMHLTCSPSTESAYAVLCHLKLLARRAPAVYKKEYRAFFCRQTDPSYVKAVKLDILAAIADASSATAITAELVAVAEDRNRIVARKAVESLGRIALRLPDAAPQILLTLREFIDLGVEHLRGATLAVLVDYLRKYTAVGTARPVLDAVVAAQMRSPFADEDSRIALLWVLGEYGEHIPDAPYLMQSLGDNLLQESAAFRLQLLTSTVMQFFKRPPEMKAFLGRVLKLLTSDFSNADVLDRAMMYYRLLRDDPVAAAHAVCGRKQPIASFIEDRDTNVVDKLFFEEFDTLSVVYGLTAEQFMGQPGIIDDEDGADDDDDDDCHSDGEDDALWQAGHENGEAAHERGLLAHTAAHDEHRSSGSPLHLGAAASTSIQLSADADISPEEFERAWQVFQTAASFSVHTAPFANSEALEERLEEQRVFTLASGTQGDAVRLYLFAEARQAAGAASTMDDLFSDAPAPQAPTTTALYLLELIVSPDGHAQVTVKSQSASPAAFVDHLRGLLSRLTP